MKIDTKDEFTAMIEAGKQFHVPGVYPPLQLSKQGNQYHASSPNMKDSETKPTCDCFNTVDDLWRFRQRFTEEIYCFATGKVA